MGCCLTTEGGCCLTTEGLSLIVFVGGIAFFAYKNSSISVTVGIWYQYLFNHEYIEGRRKLDMETKQKNLEKQRKENNDRLQRKLLELNSAGFIMTF